MAAKKIKVLIDAGHAERTPGKRYGNYYEYSSNRRVARKLRANLEKMGFEVAYSVDLQNPVDTSLAARARKAVEWGADLFVSIHSNAHSDPAAHGTETFVHTNSTASVPIAQRIQTELVRSLGTSNRGVKKAAFGVLSGTYRHMLAVLTEGEFFTNPKRNAWMLTPDYDNKYANGVSAGIGAYYGVDAQTAPVQAGRPVPAPLPSASNPGDMVVVKAKNLYTYESKDWQDKGPIVEQGEAFTVVATHSVDGGTMYELQSGLFITANPEHVEYQKDAIQPVKEEESKPVISKKGNTETNSVVEYLQSIGQKSSFSHRSKLAAQYGIKNYKGTVEQNTNLLNALRTGKTSSAAPVKKKRTVHLPKSASRWGTYRLGVTPIKKNIDWYLAPAKFGGLTYEILDEPQKNVFTIMTSRGKRNIYADPKITGAVIR